jgi:hypothetical protein
VNADHFSLSEGECFEECERWLGVRKTGISVDFRSLLRFGSGLPELTRYLIDDSLFEENRPVCDTRRIESMISWRLTDCCLFIVKSICQLMLIEDWIEHLIDLCHPCIAVPMGFVFPAGLRTLKVVGLHSELGSLAEVVSGIPMWWTPTAKAKAKAKAKAVAGFALSLCFVHSFGVIHSGLTANNIVFDSDHRIQIKIFLYCLSEYGTCGFSDERWNPEVDIRVFGSLLFLIVVGSRVKGEMSIPATFRILFRT